VTQIKREGHLYRIELACPLPVQAHITEYSLHSLQVETGKEFYLAFKASAVKLY
jgi:molybdopterin-binding protein